MKGKDLITLLEKEGWQLDRVRGSHHIMIKGKKTLVIPVHTKDIGTGLLHKILKQAGLK